MKGWMWFRTIPDGMMILGGVIILYDLVQKTYFAKKQLN
jgi:nitric oxide reductase subunit B